MIAHSVKFILSCHFPLYFTPRFVYVSGYISFEFQTVHLMSRIIQNEGKSWSEFYRFVNRSKGNRENIPAIKDYNGGLIIDPVDKANNLNYYYASVSSCERDIPDIRKFNSPG